MKHALTAAFAATLLLASPAIARVAPPQRDHSQAQPATAQWARGDKVPKTYQKSQYTVSDWRHRNLKAPAKGSRWVRNDNSQYALTDRRGTVSEIANQSDHPDTHRWSRGERVPSSYRGGDYVVSDWHARHLKKPGRGYHWVHVNNQYLLIAIATGLIGSLIADGQ